MAGEYFQANYFKQIKLINNFLILSFLFFLSFKLLWFVSKNFYWNEFVVANVSFNGWTCMEAVMVQNSIYQIAANINIYY